MPQREELYLGDILIACQHVTQFVQDKSLDDWMADELLHFGVLQRLTVIGEAARQLDPEVWDRYPEVPWRDLIAFRNLAVHDYFAVEWALVWAIATIDVPGLLEQLRGILAADYPLVFAALDED